ncbi:hypothetical protein ACHAWF_003432 [Thalassiosira exigua]
MPPRSSTLRFLALVAASAVVAGFAPPPSLGDGRLPRGGGGGTTLPSTLATSHDSAGATSSFGPTTTAFDASESAPRDVSALDGWASSSGIQRAPSFALDEVPPDDGGLGADVRAVATADAPAGTPVLYVPERLVLSSDKAAAELRTADMAEAEAAFLRSGADESELRRYYLTLKVLTLVRDGPSSPHRGWLESLPRRFSNAASMTDFCLRCLPPLMAKLAGMERTDMRRATSPEAVSAVPFLDDGIKGDRGLMADYFNHGSDYTEIEATYDEAGNYYAYATYDVPAGAPLRIQYADPRNPSHLLARYGFLDEDCPATYCKLLPPAVNQDMVDLGYDHDRMLFYKSGEVADEHLADANVMERQALMTAHRAGDYDAKLALHNKYYPQTSAALLEHVDSFVEDIDKLLAKAETIGVDDPDSVYVRYEHPRLPLIHKHNKFVRETFANVRARYSPEVDWREATRVTVQECDETECAVAECVQTYDGEWACEGGLGDRPKTQTVIAAQ